MGVFTYIVIQLYPTTDGDWGLYSTELINSCTQPQDGVYTVYSLHTTVPNHKMGSIKNIVYIELYTTTR